MENERDILRNFFYNLSSFIFTFCTFSENFGETYRPFKRFGFQKENVVSIFGDPKMNLEPNLLKKKTMGPSKILSNSSDGKLKNIPSIRHMYSLF